MLVISSYEQETNLMKISENSCTCGSFIRSAINYQDIIYDTGFVEISIGIVLDIFFIFPSAYISCA